MREGGVAEWGSEGGGDGDEGEGEEDACRGKYAGCFCGGAGGGQEVDVA